MVVRGLCCVLLLSFLACGRTELALFTACGNGLVEEGEQCDDGNDVDHDACDNSCRPRECGNGIVDTGEECDLGSDNEDCPALLLTQGALWRPVMPVDRAADATSFYAYVSESSHTGFEAVDLSALFLYRDTQTGRLDLITHHGIDQDTSGITLEHGLVDMSIDALPAGAGVVLADEGDELFLEPPSRAIGRWEFWRNTDGGVVGPLPFPGAWSIRVAVEFFDGIARWRYVHADGTEEPLQPDEVAVLTAFAFPSSCRTDCTIPRCGDGYVDGGEVCDDGNTAGGDGCASDCRSLGDD